MANKSFPHYCQLTFECEGGKLRAVLRPHCPGKASGVTIGPGYDMKERESADVIADLETAGVPSATAKKLAGGVGKSGATASSWITTTFPGHDAVITAAASSNLFTHVYPKYAELVRKKVSELWEAEWDALALKMKEILVDLAFRGDLCRFKGGATKHEKLIKPLVIANDYAGFRALINDFSYWQDNTNLKDSRSGGPNGRITARGKWLDGPPPPAVSPVHFPLDLGCGTAPDQDTTAAYYAHTEVEHRGGYFPIGANTVWHGGLHLHTKVGTPVHALWDGKLIAARLSDDPDKALRHYGSVSFMLVEHELSGATLNKLRPKGKLIGYKVRIEAVKLRDAGSLSGAKLGLLKSKDLLELLDPKLTKADGYSWAHVKVEKAADSALSGKSGYVAIKSQWYWARREKLDAKLLDAAKTYKLYSLYMHLGVEALEAENKALAEMSWLQAAPNSSDAALSKAVGLERDNVAADVKLVQARLKVHEHYSGPVSGKCDKATLDAILSFQELLVQRGEFSTADQVVGTRGKTWKNLQKAPAKRALDSELVGELRGGEVVALDVPVHGGQQLWTSGEYGSSGYRTGMMHWELFSPDNLVPGWTSVEDDDEDFNLDNSKIIALVDQDEGWWDSDDILTADEVARFYEAQSKAKRLRRYACKFISEWGIDLDKAIPKMKDASMFSTYGLEARMSPYLWWQEAADAGVALPASAKCWHYNPITFTRALAGVMPSRSGHDEPTHSGDHVYAYRDNKKVPHYSQGDSRWGKRTLGNKSSISAKGCAITSVAMILSYYGRSITPKTIDEHLDDNNGYSGDSVLWSVAFKAGESAGGVKFGARKIVKANMSAVLDERLAANKPTLARVDYASDTDGNYNHFVVIVGRHKDGHYIMNDPATRKGNGASDPSNDNLIEKTSRKQGYELVQLDIVDPV